MTESVFADHRDLNRFLPGMHTPASAAHDRLREARSLIGVVNDPKNRFTPRDGRAITMGIHRIVALMQEHPDKWLCRDLTNPDLPIHAYITERDKSALLVTVAFS